MEVCSQNFNDPFTVLLKVNGNKCNMRCTYCSELPKKFKKEQCEFDLDKISDILSKLPRDVDIILHGGEPTLIGKENVKKIALIIKELGFTIKPSIQTNGFLKSDWIDFFDKERNLIKVSVSIDGDETCNKFRKTGKNKEKEAFDRINAFLHGIDEKGIEFRCIATVNSLSWNKGEDIVKYFAQFKNLKFVRLNPCFDIDSNGVKEWAITPVQYLSCLKAAFNSMLKLQTYRQFKLDPIMDIIENSDIKSNMFAFKCGKFSSIFPDGMVTSCDAMREVKQNVSIGENMFKDFWHPAYTNQIIDMCKGCVNLNICQGGCPPLMDRYMKYDVSMLDQYCHYRVEIRKFIRKELKIEP